MLAPSPDVIATIVSYDDLVRRRYAILDEVGAGQFGHSRDEFRTAPQDWQNEPMCPSEQCAVALWHQSRMQVVNADNVLAVRDRREIAEAQQPPTNVPWQLQLNPELRQARPAKFRDDLHRDGAQVERFRGLAGSHKV